MSIKKEHYHTIKSQEFAITLDDDARVHEVQSEISTIHNAQLESLINKVLNQFSDDRYIFRFDQIELNLGTITAEAMSREIPLRIEETLTHYLQNALSEYRASSKYEKIEVYDTLVEQLEHFLIHGYFSWNAYTTTSATTLVDQLKLINKPALKALLLKLGKVENIRKRIINQFLDPTIEGIVEVVAEDESNYILEYRDAITKHQLKERIVESETSVFRNALWEIILAYVFLESKSFYNKKNYLEYLIEKIAKKYNQTYENLLLALYQGVASAQIPYRSGQNDFKKIVSELKDEVIEEEDLTSKTNYNNVNVNDLEQTLITIFINRTAFDSIKFTKLELLTMIQFYIKHNPHFVRFIEYSLLASFEARSLFLSFIDAKTVELLFEKIGSTDIQRALFIFEKLYTNRNHLSSLSQASFMELYHQRKKFLLLHFEDIKGSSESKFYFTLDKIIVETALQHSEVIVWLQKVSEQMKDTDRKRVINYLIKHYRYDQIIELKQEIVLFLTSNESENWHYWLENKLKDGYYSLKLNLSDWGYLISNELKKALPLSINNLFQPLLKKIYTEILKWQPNESPNNKAEINSEDNLLEDKKFLNILVDNLSNTILKISLETHYSEKWYVEVNELINDNASTFSIPIKQLIDALLVYYSKNNPNELIVWRLKKLIENNFSVANTLLREDLHQIEKLNLVQYSIENGHLPWWINAYSWNTFNNQFSSALKEEKSRNKLIYSLKRSSFGLVVFHKLNTTQKILVFNYLLEGIASINSKKWLNELYNFITGEAILSGTISSTYYQEFEGRLISLLLKDKLSESMLEKEVLVQITQLLSFATMANSYDAKRIFQIIHTNGNKQLFKRCISQKNIKPFWESYLVENNEGSLSSLIAYLRVATSDEFKALLHSERIIAYALQSSEIRKLLVTKLTSNELLLLLSIWSKTSQFDRLSRSIILLQVAPNSDWVAGKMKLLEEFISQINQTTTLPKDQQLNLESNSYSLLWLQVVAKQGKLGNYITSLLGDKERFSPYLIHMFENEQTRTFLIQELSLKEVITVVKYRLSPNQLMLFDRSIKVLDYFFQNISTQEKKQINNLFFGLLLGKLSTSSTLQPWQTQNWVRFINYILEKTLGISKKNQLLTEVVDLKWKHTETKEELKILFDLAQKKDTLSTLDVEVVSSNEKPYKKLGEVIPKELLNPIYIKHAGLIILAPYLKMLFEKCQLFNTGGEFKDNQSRQKAIHLLEFAAFGHNEYQEHDLVINKVLCGMELSDTIDRSIYLSDSEKDIVNSLLKAVTQQWGALKETSISGLRETFLQRFGRLEEEEEQYYLKVEKKAFDMLLDQIPWNISTIKLSWMKKMLVVEWR